MHVCANHEKYCRCERSHPLKPEMAAQVRELPDESPLGTQTSQVPDTASAVEQIRAKAYHDVRASLAIINGYSLALDSTFHELIGKYNTALGDSAANTQATADLKMLEADCRFCLSRLCRSVEQLKERLEVNEAASATDTAMVTPR